jgi:hypothetical protein
MFISLDHGERMPEDTMREDVFPMGHGPSLNELVKMERDHAFQCLNCQEVFETVFQWAQHALGRNGDIFPGIKASQKAISSFRAISNG